MGLHVCTGVLSSESFYLKAHIFFRKLLITFYFYFSSS